MTATPATLQVGGTFSCSSFPSLHVRMMWIVLLFKAMLLFDVHGAGMELGSGMDSESILPSVSILPSISINSAIFMETVTNSENTQSIVTSTSLSLPLPLPTSTSIELLRPYTSSTPPQPSTSSPSPQPSTSFSPLPTSTSSTPSTSSIPLQPSTSSTSSIPLQPSTSSTSSIPLQPSTSSTSSILLQPSTSSTPLQSSMSFPLPGSSPPIDATTTVVPTLSGLESIFITPSSVLPSPSPTMLTTTPTQPGPILFQVLLDALGGVEGFAGACVAIAIIVMLLLILFCLCCCCICKRNCAYAGRKRNVDFPDPSFENKETNDFISHNGVVVTGYSTHELSQRHYDHMSGAEQYHYHETSIDKAFGSDHLNNSQALPSQISDVFQKNTLPELSPMTYSLTTNNYPLPPEDNELYLNKLSASTLRQPTMFGLSLQHEEESKSAHGSRLSITGSKASIYSSRPSIYGSRTLHGSKPMVYNSMTSRDSLLGVGHSRQNTLEDEEDLILSPTLPQINSNSTEVPTRDSPLSRPLISASSHPLGQGRKDFASLTCIFDHHDMDSLHTSPEHEVSTKALTSPKRKQDTKRDLTSLTSLSGMGSEVGGHKKEDTIPEEEEMSNGSKVDKSKETSSSSNKKGKTRKMSRLEKLTSLDYIRQSFRIKKKRVSFEKTPETTPKVTKKNSKKTTPIHDAIFSNEHAADTDDNVMQQQHHTSNTSSDMFSPTDTTRSSGEGYFRPYNEHGNNSMMGYGQLSQPTYYLPSHAIPYQSGYPYPQLSQQYQLSQGYTYNPNYHTPIKDHYSGRGFMGGGAAVRDSVGGHYQEVITPDYLDITTPDHHHFRERSVDTEHKQGSEYSYDLRPHSPHGNNYDRSTSPSPEKFTEKSDSSDRPNPSPDLLDTTNEYGELHLGIHPEYSSFEMNSFLPNQQHHISSGYSPEGRFTAGGSYDRRRYRKGEGHVSEQRRPSLDHIIGDVGRVGGMIPEDTYNSISVDDPTPHHYTVQHRKKDNPTHNVRAEQRYSGYSESSTISDTRYPSWISPH